LGWRASADRSHANDRQRRTECPQVDSVHLSRLLIKRQPVLAETQNGLEATGITMLQLTAWEGTLGWVCAILAHLV
jgi:hypothetical protein